MSKSTTKARATHECILKATIHCYGVYGVENTTLEQVAAEAGMSRTTVYRYAGNRRELLNKVLLRDANQALSELEVITRYYDNLEEVVLESILFLMRRRNNFEMQHILYGDSSGAQQDDGLPLNILTDLVEQSLTHHYANAESKGLVSSKLPLPLLADWLGRITISLISQPSHFTQTEESLRTYLKAVLCPIFHLPSSTPQPRNE
ncbi:TetR/AcrR family transcriptional regulator [Endozoicomonas numazuensis]|nr:TetR/AcrR family transcriptional regulator [Endozoicomonas numazuensis]